GDEAEPVEAAAVEGAVLVEEGHRGGEPRLLDGAQLVARRGVEARRPEALRACPVRVRAQPLERLEPGPARRFGAVATPGHRRLRPSAPEGEGWNGGGARGRQRGLRLPSSRRCAPTSPSQGDGISSSRSSPTFLSSPA